MSDEFAIDEWLAEDVTPEQKKDWPAWTPVWDGLVFAGLSSRAVHLYAVLGRYAGQGGAWPSRRTLAGHLGCSMDSLDRAKGELVDNGWVSVVGRVRDSDGGQTSNLYQLHQSPDVRHPGRTVAAPPLGTGAAPRTTTIKNDNPPTPQTAAAEPGQPIRTYPASPLVEVDRVEPTASGRAQLGLIKDQIRPPRESEPEAS